MNTISCILFLLASGLLNIGNSFPMQQYTTDRMHEPSILTIQPFSSYKIKPADDIFAFPDMESYFAGSDQNDDHNLYHNKTILFRVLPTGHKKLLILKKEIFISPHSSSYFELDIPPPLLDV